MDGCEALRVQRRREVGLLKHSSFQTEKNNGNLTRPSQTKEVNSRYKSPMPVSRRSASPNVARTVNAATQLAPKRAISTERKRQLPSRPTTPVQDTAFEPQSRKVTGSRLSESLWPSTMRSLSVSFQSDSISVPVSKKEKPVSPALSDRTLKPSSNVAQKQEAKRATMPSKPKTPERRSPLRGRNSSGQSENSRPVDGLPTRLIDQHRWPSRSGVQLSANTLVKKMDLSDEVGNSSSVMLPSIGVSSLRRLSTEGSRLSSPCKASASRCMGSPSSTRPSTPTSSRGTSPSRIRPCSPTRQLSTTASSVLSFVSDLKRGKKSSNQLEDAHHLRLLYNRNLQWRFANAQADAALHIQKVVAEETLYNVWWENLELRNSVMMKRINLQQHHLELKLNVVLNEQLAYLEDWASLEMDHSTPLSGVINDLESSTLRLPITGGARVGIVSLKGAISSAVDVLQAITSSIRSVLPKVERTSCSVSELAKLATLERATLDECEAMLASTASMQVEEYSLRAQLIQQLQGLSKKNEQLFRAI